uniref:Uncharacterized protein n=1 Tax=Pyrodinium bahamense TaxID=73915 RepID=A0A7S0FNW1_9DINO
MPSYADGPPGRVPSSAPEAEGELLDWLAELRWQNDRRWDPLAFERCDPWVAEEPGAAAAAAEQRLLGLKEVRRHNRERLEDAEWRLRYALAEARQSKAASRVATPHATPRGGSLASPSRPASVQRSRPQGRPRSAPSQGAASAVPCRAAEEDLAEAYARTLEHRCRANNWVSETCPYDPNPDVTKPWKMHQNAIMREKRVQEQVMRGFAESGWHPYKEWVRRRDHRERHRSLCIRMKMAAILSQLQTDKENELADRLKSMFANEVEDRPEALVSAEHLKPEELEKVAREGLEQALKDGDEDELVAAIRLGELAHLEESDLEQARRTLGVLQRLKHAACSPTSRTRTRVQSVLRDRREVCRSAAFS